MTAPSTYTPAPGRREAGADAVGPHRAHLARHPGRGRRGGSLPQRAAHLAAALAPTVLIALACLAAPAIATWAGADAGAALPLSRPSPAHPLGTDQLGRDLLGRVGLGMRTSVAATAAAVAATSLIGTLVGLIAGYTHRAGQALMALTNLVLAFPGIVLAMALAALVGGGLTAAVVVLALTSWPKYARLVRSGVHAVRGSDYVHASRLLGTSPVRVLAWHVMPQVLPLVLVTASLDVGTLMVELAGLSFLGLGAQPPTAELGLMLSQNRSLLLTHPWALAGPALAMCAVVAASHLAADALRELSDQPLSPTWEVA